MVIRTRLARFPSNPNDKSRLERIKEKWEKKMYPPVEGELGQVKFDDTHLWTFKLGEKIFPVGYYGRVPKSWKEMFQRKPPFIKMFQPEGERYVRVNWKTKVMYDAITGEPLGRLPEKLKWEKYVPIALGVKGGPKSIGREELEEAKQTAREIKERERLEKEREQEMLRLGITPRKKTLTEKLERFVERIP